MTRRALLLALVLALSPALAMKCGGGFKTILIDDPVEGELVDDGAVLAAARIGKNFDELTAEVRIDGVDLIGALGLVPPFQDESGVVLIGVDPVTVSGFTFTTDPGAPRTVALSAAGLPQGPHLLEVEADKNSGGSLLRSVGFEHTGLFTLEVPALGASGLPFGPEDAGSEGVLVNAILGSPLAGPPVGLSGGGELQPGPIPAAEARIQ